MRHLQYCLIIIIAAGLTACAIIPNAPNSKPSETPPSAGVSTLEVNIFAQYKFIADELNKAIPNEIFWATSQPVDNCPVDECSYQIRVLRDGEVSIGHDGKGNLVVNLPIRTKDGRVDAMQKILGVKIRKTADFSASVTATATLGFTLLPDWSATASTQLAFSVQNAEVHIGFPGGSVGISVKEKTKQLLEGQRENLQKILSTALKNKVDFKTQATSTWNQLHGVYRINENPSVWVAIDPISIKVKNPRAEANGLGLAVGVDAYLTTYVQNSRPTPPQPEKLPSLNFAETIEGRYKLAMPIRISTKTINQTIGEFIGKEFTFKAAEKIIKAKLIDGRVYTNGPDLVTYAEISSNSVFLGIFPIRVGAYFNGTPKYLPDTTTVELNPFDYDADTNNLLINKAEWFFHGKIRESLQNAIRINIGSDLEKSRQLLADKLKNMQMGQNVLIRGVVDKIAPTTIYTTADMLNIEALAEGSIKVELQ